MYKRYMQRPSVVPCTPPPSIDCDLPLGAVPLEVDFLISDDIDVWFKDYILNDPGVVPSYYFVTQEDTTNFVKALSYLEDKVKKFKTGDYIIVHNYLKSKYNVYLFTSDDWITFTGKSAYDTSEGDVDIIIDPDD